jgi:hypothetical protein
MKITIETLKNLNQSAIMELFYNEFLNYGKKCALYIARYHDMTIEYCACYIASGLFELFLTRCEKLHENENGWEFSRETMLYSFLGTKKLVKKIMAMTNYSSYFKNNAKAYNTSFKDTLNADSLSVYCEQIGEAVYSKTNYRVKAYKNSKNKYSEFRNVKRVNGHTIDIVDVLEQKENRTSKKNLSLDGDLFEGVSFKDSIVSYYPTPEQALLNKLAHQYSAITSAKIRNDKKFDRLQAIEKKFSNGENLVNSEVDFLYNFKKRLNLDTLTTKELFYIVNNY